MKGVAATGPCQGVLGKLFESVTDGGDAGGGPVSDGEPVVPGSRAAVAPRAVEAALDGVGVEGGRSAPGAAASVVVGGLVGPDRDRGAAPEIGRAHV